MKAKFESATVEEIAKTIPVLGITEEDENQFYNPKGPNLSRYDSQLKRMEEILAEMDKKAIGRQPFLSQVYLRISAYISGKSVKELVDSQHQKYLEDIARKLDTDITYYKDLIGEMDKEIEEKKTYRDKAGLFYTKFELIESEVKRKIEEIQGELYRKYEQQTAKLTGQDAAQVDAKVVDHKEIASLEVELEKMRGIDLKTALDRKEFAAVEFRNADVYVKALSAKRAFAEPCLAKLKNKRTAIEITRINKEIVSKEGLDPIGFVETLRETDGLMAEIDRGSSVTDKYTDELLKISTPTDEDYKPTVSFEEKAQEMTAQTELFKSNLDGYVRRRLEELHGQRRSS
ncbi:hypothetical protein HZB88_02115 [archaeon]|nr:hypothetical protein [archaeon]